MNNAMIQRTVANDYAHRVQPRKRSFELVYNSNNPWGYERNFNKWLSKQFKFKKKKQHRAVLYSIVYDSNLVEEKKKRLEEAKKKVWWKQLIAERVAILRKESEETRKARMEAKKRLYEELRMPEWPIVITKRSKRQASATASACIRAQFE